MIKTNVPCKCTTCSRTFDVMKDVLPEWLHVAMPNPSNPSTSYFELWICQFCRMRYETKLAYSWGDFWSYLSNFMLVPIPLGMDFIR